MRSGRRCRDVRLQSLHSACLAEGLQVQVLCGCSEHHRFCVYCGELRHEPVPCAQMMVLCKTLGELHVNLEDLHLEQYRACDELPLVLQWPRGRADNCVSLPADLETMDLITTTTSQPTLRAAEPRWLRNVFENFFDARRSQLICSAEIALPILTCWDLLVVDKPADARSRSDKSIEQILAETTRPCPRCFVLIRRAGVCVHEESVATELRRELQQAMMQVSRGSCLAGQQQRQLESAPVEPLPECFGTLRTKATVNFVVAARNCCRKYQKEIVRLSSVRLVSRFRWFRT